MFIQNKKLFKNINEMKPNEFKAHISKNLPHVLNSSSWTQIQQWWRSIALMLMSQETQTLKSSMRLLSSNRPVRKCFGLTVTGQSVLPVLIWIERWVVTIAASSVCDIQHATWRNTYHVFARALLYWQQFWASLCQCQMFHPTWAFIVYIFKWGTNTQWLALFSTLSSM